MQDSPLRVGLIGRTNHGNYGHGIDTVWREIPECKVVAVADEHDVGRLQAQGRTGAAHEYVDYREMLDREQLDLVAICPRWTDKHAEYAIAAVEHGCSIYMEKPFVRTPAEADAVVAMCEMRQKKIAIAHQTRFSPTIAVARKLIADGVIGNVLEFRARGKEDRRGGTEDLWVLGSHVIDLMRSFTGDPIECSAQIFEKGKPFDPKNAIEGAEGLGPLGGDTVHARYLFANGTTGYFSSVRDQGLSGSRFAIQIFGSKGILEIEPGFPGRVSLLQDPLWSPARSRTKWQTVTSAGIDQPEPLKGGLHQGNVYAVRDLLAAIRENREPLCGMYDGKGVVEMIMAVFQSHTQQVAVKWPLVSRTHPWSVS